MMNISARLKNSKRNTMIKEPRHIDTGDFSSCTPNMRYKDGDRLIYTHNDGKTTIITIKEI